MQAEITLDTSLRYLKGVGPERHKILERLGLLTLEDLFYFFPRRYEDRSQVKKVPELVEGQKECVRGQISSRGIIRMRRGQILFRTVMTEGDKTLFCSWFNQPYMAKVFSPRSTVTFYGKVEREGKFFRMIHPEFELHAPESPKPNIHSGRIVPIYPLTENLSQKGLRQLIFYLITNHLSLPKESLPLAMRKKLDFKDAAFALRQIHFPGTFADLERAYRRLVFDEFFLMQTVVRMKRNQFQKENQGLSHKNGEETVGRLLESSGFTLTEGQNRTIDQVLSDMRRSRPMNRLVQGDVGSGKTIVSAAALAFTAANGFQGALMAPTEVLAQQHYFTVSRWLEPLGIACGFLAQNMKPQEKGDVLRRVLDGEIQILIGTHALIQDRVRFKHLGLVVVDEQHKFGVFQRAKLREKSGTPPHFLLTTATPIPRTLALTLYGDLDISTIRELPGGRQPVRTFWVEEGKRKEVYALLDSLLEKGRQAYVICPLIEEKDFSAKGVLTAREELASVFSHRRVGVLHGRMKSAEKEKVMRDFKERRLDLLVSTVVIEVGVDVPNATLMIIENAERFGLAQLHQLRGRVGRGTEESFCVLFSESPGEETAARLSAFEEMRGGFEIADKDLEIRGAGDIVGEKQHGLPQLRIGDLGKDMELLVLAREEATRLVDGDPRLGLPPNRQIREAIRRRYRLSEKKKLTVVA